MSTSKLSVYYVTAHPDDWQLFHGEVAWRDLQTPGVYGVFITVTAGDAGRDDGYWEAREAGQIASILACLPGAPDDYTHTPGIAKVNEHNIQRDTFTDSLGESRAVLYSLRLPDGNVNGSGFEENGYASIAKLSTDEITEISALGDVATTYHYWSDLVETIQTIMADELEIIAGGTDHPCVNANQHWLIEPDHSDHVTVGKALAEFVIDRYNRVWWQSYQTEELAGNLFGDTLDHKRTTFKAYRTKMTAEGFNNKKGWDEEWEKWGAKDYYLERQWDDRTP